MKIFVSFSESCTHSQWVSFVSPCHWEQVLSVGTAQFGQEAFFGVLLFWAKLAIVRPFVFDLGDRLGLPDALGALVALFDNCLMGPDVACFVRLCFLCARCTQLCTHVCLHACFSSSCPWNFGEVLSHFFLVCLLDACLFVQRLFHDEPARVWCLGCVALCCNSELQQSCCTC